MLFVPKQHSLISRENYCSLSSAISKIVYNVSTGFSILDDHSLFPPIWNEENVFASLSNSRKKYSVRSRPSSHRNMQNNRVL